MLTWLKILYLTLMQDRLIFKPDHRRVMEMQEPAHYGLKNVRAHDLVTQDKHHVHLWHHPPEREGRPTMLFFHGNTGHLGDVGPRGRKDEAFDRAYRIVLLQELANAGFGYIAVTYRGYGKSSNTPPTEAGITHDVDKILEFALEAQNIPHRQLGIIGESLGGSVAMIAADRLTQLKKPPVMVAAIAAFHSLRQKVIDLHPALPIEKVEARLRHRFHTADHLRNLSGETFLLFLAPGLDTVTPKVHSQSLAAAAQEAGIPHRYVELKHAGHITWKPEDVVNAIEETLKS